MAGGVWTTQNKVRPGAYINFETEKPIVTEVGTRGIATVAMDLDWGDENKLIEVTMEDLAGGISLAKLGFVLTDDKAKIPSLALQNASLLKVYRLNKNGVKASSQLISYDEYNLTTDTEIDETKTYYTRSGAGTTESPYVYTPVAEPDVASISTYYEKTSYGLLATAKYPGTLGNKIAILISNANEYGQYEVQTYVDGYLVDNQLAAVVSDLTNNEFVDFTGSGTISAVTATLLAGGTNGAIPSTGSGTATSYVEGYDNYFETLRLARWNTMAITVDYADVIAEAIDFIEDMRENEGKYVQAVVSNTSSADYEGIINNINGIILEDNTEINEKEFCAWVAGATAGAAMNESLTGKVIEGAVSVKDLKTNDQIVEGLSKGEFLLSLNQDGTVKVEKDINSLHTFTTKSYTFSKNRVIRELDEIGSGIENIWEKTYLGKVTNNENGRMLFKSSIIDFLTELQNDGSIDEFDIENIVVSAGNDVDAVIADIAVKPLDSMEFLYMTVNIEQ